MDLSLILDQCWTCIIQVRIWGNWFRNAGMKTPMKDPVLVMQRKLLSDWTGCDFDLFNWFNHSLFDQIYWKWTIWNLLAWRFNMVAAILENVKMIGIKFGQCDGLWWCYSVLSLIDIHCKPSSFLQTPFEDDWKSKRKFITDKTKNDFATLKYTLFEFNLFLQKIWKWNKAIEQFQFVFIG